MAFWIILVLVLAVLLMLSVDRILERIGVYPERPEETSAELPLLAGGVERWASTRRNRSQVVDVDGDSDVQVEEQNSQATRSSTRR